MNAFLGVERSLAARRWRGPPEGMLRMAEAMARQSGLALPLCRVLARLGVAPEHAGRYLEPTLRELLPDPLELRDADRAARRLVAALNRRERVAVFADYDVDGAASAALVLDWLRLQGQRATLYVPDRIDEGYGPNPEAMAALARNHELIVTVDCGTLSHEAIAAAEGTEVIVLDHHLGGATLPPALAVVNPNRRDESGALGHLCAAAVVFLILVRANRLLREDGHRPPDLMEMLDLVALATVADVAPLTGVNRAFVRQGLKVMARRARPGLAALSDVARLNAPPDAQQLGYALGPRINAGGRVGRADLGARLLATRDRDEAQALAERLEQLNAERRAVEARVQEAALAQAETRGLGAPLVWAAGEGWHPGVVGIVAARLKAQTSRPAVVIGLEGNEGKGSGRSVSGIDLGAAVQRLADEGLLLKGGGHRMAAGLTVARDRLEAAMARLSELLERQGAGAAGPEELRLDGLLATGAATRTLVEELERAGPFGAGAPAPRFAFADQQILHARRVGTGHLKLRFSDGSGPALEAIAFGAFDSPLGAALENHGGGRFHLAGRLELNHWNGRLRVQLRLEDAAPAGPGRR